MRNVVIVTNMWEDVSAEDGEAREKELASEDIFFKPALDNGAKMHRHDNTPESAEAIIHQIVGNQSIPLLIQTELVDKRMSLLETTAGKELNKELMEQAKKQMEELRQLESDMRAAIRTKDEETRKELEFERKKLKSELESVLSESRKLESDLSKERADLERRMSEMEIIGREHAQKQEADYRERIREMENRLQNEQPLEKEGIARQLGELYRGLRRITAGGFFSHIGRAIDALVLGL
jgi:DNA repair exonuclease SbcCD ATPase subunit